MTSAVFTDEDLLELILLQGGLELVLVAASVCRIFRAVAAAPSLWRSLGSAGAPPAASAPVSADTSTRELYRERWESERWASGSVTPAASVVWRRIRSVHTLHTVWTLCMHARIHTVYGFWTLRTHALHAMHRYASHRRVLWVTCASCR